MSEPKFTTGPWHVSENQPTVVGNKEKAVCKCELDWNLSADERAANAALIAVAPEMYELINDLHKIISKNISHGIGRWLGIGASRKEALGYAALNIKYARRIKHVLKKARGEE